MNHSGKGFGPLGGEARISSQSKTKFRFYANLFYLESWLFLIRVVDEISGLDE